jgi:hypothetical protein
MCEPLISIATTVLDEIAICHLTSFFVAFRHAAGNELAAMSLSAFLLSRRGRLTMQMLFPLSSILGSVV